MSRLRTVFEACGCTNVLTYINSGNVIFSDDRSADQLDTVLEAAIQKEFGFAVPVVLRDVANIQQLCDKIPDSWTNDTVQRTDVLFLWKELDDETILQKIQIKPDIEQVLYLDGALVWNIGRENVMRGGGLKLIKTDLYKHMTIRNINTVRKLHELLTQA